VTSALTPTGSTREWRATRLAILQRDRWLCRVPLPDGGLCLAHANTCGHIIARCAGGDDRWINLRAECAAHNYSAGARLARPPPNVRRDTRW